MLYVQPSLFLFSMATILFLTIMGHLYRKPITPEEPRGLKVAAVAIFTGIYTHVVAASLLMQSFGY